MNLIRMFINKDTVRLVACVTVTNALSRSSWSSARSERASEMLPETDHLKSHLKPNGTLCFKRSDHQDLQHHEAPCRSGEKLQSKRWVPLMHQRPAV